MSQLKILLIFGVIFLLGCKSSKKFEREVELRNYLQKNHEQSLDNYTGNIFILQAGFCGACTESVIGFIDRHFSKQVEQKIFILKEKRERFEEMFNSYINSKVFVDKDFQMAKYGLVFTTDIFLNLKNGEIEYWSFINSETINKLERRLK